MRGGRWLFIAPDFCSQPRSYAVILGKGSTNGSNYRKSMRAPVAVACNRIISAQSDSEQEGGGGDGNELFSSLAPAKEKPPILPLVLNIKPRTR